MTDTTKKEIEALLQVSKALYHSAREREVRADQLIRLLRELANANQETSRTLPKNIASAVKEQIAAETKTAAEKIFEMHKEANIAAEKAVEAYDRAVKFSFWRFAVLIFIFGIIGIGAMMVTALLILHKYVII